MNAVETEEAISKLVLEAFELGGFTYAFLKAFGKNDKEIKRLRKGALNRTDIDGAVLLNRNIHILATDPTKGAEGVEAGVNGGVKSCHWGVWERRGLLRRTIAGKANWF